MIRKLIPVLLALFGLGAGTTAGFILRPTPELAVEGAAEAAQGDTPAHADTDHPPDPESLPDYVKLNNQFVVPILKDGRVISMVVVSLSLEVVQGKTEEVYSREPKLRDAFLQVMFDHANAGGFQGSFTDAANLVPLRKALLEVAQTTLGKMVSDVLIVDIIRQDS